MRKVAQTQVEICSKHGAVLHAFRGGRWRCKTCESKYQKVHKEGANYKEYERLRNDNAQKKRSKLVTLFGGACELCGYDRFHSVLEFHHINYKEKQFTVRNFLDFLDILLHRTAGASNTD